jgi:hypothetical protein
MLRLGLTILAVVALAAGAGCGGSGTTPKPIAKASPLPSATPTPSPTPAPPTCPTGATVGAELGFAVPDPIGVPASAATTLPAGAHGIACEYAGKSFNVIIEKLTGVSPALISSFSDKFPVAFQPVSGVGDQARSFFQPLNGGKDNEGVVATKGSTLVAVTATATPASLAQVETLVKDLL